MSSDQIPDHSFRSHTMKCTLLAALMFALPLVGFAQQSRASKLFTYQYTNDDLPNGLRLVTVPTDYPNLVALYAVVSVDRKSTHLNSSHANSSYAVFCLKKKNGRSRGTA